MSKNIEQIPTVYCFECDRIMRLKEEIKDLKKHQDKLLGALYMMHQLKGDKSNQLLIHEYVGEGIDGR